MHTIRRASAVAFGPDPENAVRGELLGVDRLDAVAEALATVQSIVPRGGTARPLSRRLQANGRVLGSAYAALCQAVREGERITPAAEWLVDNFHDVEVQLNEIREDLPPGYYRQLPKLAEGELRGFPRVYGLARTYVAHTDSRFVPATLARFVEAYQRGAPLTIGELWAVTITLRIILVENLRRTAELIIRSRVARKAADALADRLLGIGCDAETASATLAQYARRPLPSAFAVQLLQRLRDQDPRVTPALLWLDERLAAQGTTADDIVQAEIQAQGATNMTVRNAITSLRLIGAVDWPDFFESVSLVDAALRTGSDFADMDFPTRNQYRRSIEELARGSVHSELEVVRRLLVVTAKARLSDAQSRACDPGYHLLLAGRPSFEAALGYRVPLAERFTRAAGAAGVAGLFGMNATATAGCLAGPLYGLSVAGAPGWLVGTLAVLGVFPAMDTAVALVNRLIVRGIQPTCLPGLALREGVPASLRTMVVVPTLLMSPEEVGRQIERLEVHYLASADGDLHFALLTDWADADSEQVPGDEALLAFATEGIARLNERHDSEADGPRFRLLHRRRLWNPAEGKWIGWERKRGKLHELNRLLRGATDTSYLGPDGRPPAVPDGVRFVITLDADTRLPRGAAKRLVGKLAHPLNRPRLDEAAGRVVEGYGILQPRVTASLPADHEGSRFQQVYSSPGGLDPYAFAVSDVYQDLFKEGSYSGKGIYDVDVFEAALEGRIPENTLLSHDLLEGTFVRAALVTDVEMVEEFPTRYNVDAARHHRWARGDWQLLPWILGRGAAPSDSPVRDAIPAIGRWKMADNLRRTVSAPATLLALGLGWTQPVAIAAAWTAFLVALLAIPTLMPWLLAVLPSRKNLSLHTHAVAVRDELGLGLTRLAFQFATLPHQAWLMADAKVRTLLRLYVTRRHMLEWVTAAQASGGPALALAGFYRQMGGGVALTIAAAFFWALAGGPGTWIVAGPLLALWGAAPAFARWMSLPAPMAGRTPIDAADRQALRLVARRTWRYFETFVTPGENHLPPDNFQEAPRPVVAHRTSPTNLGLYLLSIVTARDFGWIGTFEALERLEASMTSMERLERHQGHFYNWYDTQDLRPLEPKYISSVDSGNLAGHLITLVNALREIATIPVFQAASLAGIEDAVGLTREALAASAGHRRQHATTRKHLHDGLDTLMAALHAPLAGSADIYERLSQLTGHADVILDIARTLTSEAGSAAEAEVLAAAAMLHDCVRSHGQDLASLMPWAAPLGQAHARLAADGAPGTAVFLDGLRPLLTAPPTLAGLAEACEALAAHLETVAAPADWAADRRVTGPLLTALTSAAGNARRLEFRLARLAERAAAMWEGMAFGFLLDESRQLLSIGYTVAEGKLDGSCYDLLASEARLASFVAIAKGDVPTKHWFRLGRAVTPVARNAALVSWSGSMFEYLMPSLVMDAPVGSQLELTMRLVVARQIQYATGLGVPWGISESAYNARDLELTYQYLCFGIPDLGLKRDMEQNIVIAPYATVLAAMFDPQAATRNLVRLAAAGGKGRYGWYEALDYTPSRVPQGAAVGVVQAYMAHHQGMSLVALANTLLGGIMRTRFHAEPIVQATELLLQERSPRDVAFGQSRVEKVLAAGSGREFLTPVSRRFASPHGPVPRTHLLSNGTYAVMLTGAGSGYSRSRDLEVTRWREDVTCDSAGSYFYLRDAKSGDLWSAGYQPTGIEPDTYEVSFWEDHAVIERRDGSISTRLEVVVSPQDNAEVRRISLTNHGPRVREIEVTSYAEVVLATRGADVAHPAFSKLFVQTEFDAEAGALLATRRRRSPGDPEVWAAHLAVVEGDAVGEMQYETDRARFIGRGRSLREAVSVTDGRPLSNTVGTVLDPIFSLRRRVRLAPGATAHVAFWTMIAPTRAEALDLADRHGDAAAYDRTLTLAWTQAQAQIHHLGIDHDEAHLFQRLANHVLYANPDLRPAAVAEAGSNTGQSALWVHGISGDLPIVLCRIDEADDQDIVRQLLRAHTYWRVKQLAVDLVIVNERPPSYDQDLQVSLEALVRVFPTPPNVQGEGASGQVYILRGDLISHEVRTLLATVPRVRILSRRGSLADQVKRLPGGKPPAAPPNRPWQDELPTGKAILTRPELEFFNGLGGFAAGGTEYVTVLEPGQYTPAPWINVIANPAFGFQVSAEGCGYTWAINSRENQLTPWSNDPVSDRPGEVIYVRDEDTGVVWGPTALPTRVAGATYVARHGQGYSRFEHTSNDVALELVQYVPLDDPIKISRLKVRNLSGRPRRLTVTAYVDWVLGTSRAASAPFVVTALDAQTGALCARNPWSAEFGGQVAFMDLAGRQRAWTGDRTEFVGRNGTLGQPAALTRSGPLSGRVGAGIDPCGALQTEIELAPGGVIEVVFFLGEAASQAEASALVTRYRGLDLEAVLGAVKSHWDDVLGTVQVKTPDRALDILLNSWLLYQTLACRIWARAAFYQASGAYGFRDQLQDLMALCVARPALAREHLLRAAARQFVEGDVQHWWLPRRGQGVRTRMTDDRAWLPYVAAHYIATTGDQAVLDEVVPFLEGPLLATEQHEHFFQPQVAEETATLFEHCARALDVSLAVGAHGLPLIGTGDWNDGMNRVGAAGAGESTWLGWFLHTTLSTFADVADGRDEPARASAWRTHAAGMLASIEREGWDGDWYRRGYFDDGTPLGSCTGTECQIDAIAQSWAVMSGAADAARSAHAMTALDRRLVRPEDRLVLLFTPPFDRTPQDPGYIKGYPPGLRENGGQYTHAAAWSLIAFAMLGDGNKARDLFSLMNPINLTKTRAGTQRYKVEPYVVAADVYSEAPHVGRGGWTWYTGSAGWLYRAGVEWMLGFRVQGTELSLDPCVPKDWPGFELVYRHRSTTYEIAVENPRGVCRGIASWELDGQVTAGEPARLPLVDDGQVHRIVVVLG